MPGEVAWVDVWIRTEAEMSGEATSALRIDFVDFWPDFDPHDNFFTNLLSQRHRIEVGADPDLLFYSCYGDAHLRSSCKRVFVSFENRGWGFAACDFAITSDLVVHPDHFRLPLWSIWTDSRLDPPRYDLPVTPAPTDDAALGFASIVVSNAGGTTRNRVHQLLDAYRPVASGGRHLNNVGGPVTDKIAFLSRFKFNIAFENSSSPGYTTEKLLEALRARTVPIYWGNPDVGDDFNTGRIISLHDFASEAEMVRRVVELDRDDAAREAMLREPWFPGDVAPPCTSRTRLADWLDAVILDERTPIAQRRSLRLVVRRLDDRRRIRARYRGRLT